MTSIRTYDELIKAYENFKKERPEDVVSNLYQELNIVRSIIASAKMQNLDVDTFHYQQIADKNLKELHNMGYKKLV